MIVSISDQKKEYNRHIRELAALVPGKSKEALLVEFYNQCPIDPGVDESNYFHAMTWAFEAFLYFSYGVDEKNFKYFSTVRFFA